MRYTYSSRHEKVVNAFFDLPESILMMNNLGMPCKITVDWDSGSIKVVGNKSGLVISIDDVLDAHYAPIKTEKKFH